MVKTGLQNKFVLNLVIKPCLEGVIMLINLSDKELLLHKDDRAFRILYDRYWQVLYKKAIARLRNEDDAKDILQEIFISIWNNRQQIEFEETLAPYIFTALKYSIIKKVERDLKKGITMVNYIRKFRRKLFDLIFPVVNKGGRAYDQGL